jgi:sigma-B regulation protein RsbU (phosphoserine phosphatase)
MLTDHRFKTLFAALGLTSWLLWVLLVLTEQLFNASLHISLDIPLWVKGVFLNVFIVCIYLFFSKQIDLEEEGGDFYQLIWEAFVTGITATAVSVVLLPLIRYFQVRFEVLEANSLLILNFLYHLELGVMLVFLVSLFTKWKKLILYKKVVWVEKLWIIFEYCLVVSLVLHIFPVETFMHLRVPLTVLLGFMAVILSINLSWVAFLNLKQKGLLMLYLIVIIACTSYFYDVLFQYSETHPIDIQLAESPFMQSCFLFLTVYGVFSELVLFFNLPTSSAFERRFSEISNFQKLSESILEGRTEKQVYEVLLESAIGIAKTNAAFLEVIKNGELLCNEITMEDARNIKRILQQSNYNYTHSKKFTAKNLATINIETNFQTILVVPLISRQQHLGSLFLLKDAINAFDNVVLNLINTYATQASITLENFSLISQTLENEKYKSELQTAKGVKDKLLPKNTYFKNNFEFFAHATSPDQVGGDYYDYFKISENKYAIIIADVSGKGTSAAFNMAQMKGIFQSLVQLDLSPDLFMKYANDAVSNCLERSSFITASYFVIDTQVKKIYYARAGHCPSLFYQAATQKAVYIEGKGLGLGIMRNEKFVNYIDVCVQDYQSGDLLMLYTDGIVECANKEGEEYGYDRLLSFVEKNAAFNLANIIKGVQTETDSFADAAQMIDDCTIVLLRFSS